jgi:hypothetical protein
MRKAQRRILHRGLGPIGSLLSLVGSLHLATGGAGATSSGDRTKRPAMKSSTMKGAKALGSKPLVETVPNREQSQLVGNGALLVSAPRNRGEATQRGKYGWAGARHIECGLEVGPPSNVTSRVKSSLIREGALLPPVVRRCLGGVEPIVRDAPLVGNEVFQNAEDWESRSSRSREVFRKRDKRASALQGSGELVPVPIWRRAHEGRRKSGREKSHINNAHYWS